MAYFGGGGVKEDLHSSLRAYIDCFMANPMPKMYPRGGGPWDQDPTLMRDFRLIREQEIKFKQAEEQIEEMKNKSRNPEELAKSESSRKGGGGGIGQSLEEYLEELGEDGRF